jgi:hypothetical protein
MHPHLGPSVSKSGPPDPGDEGVDHSVKRSNPDSRFFQWHIGTQFAVRGRGAPKIAAVPRRYPSNQKEKTPSPHAPTADVSADGRDTHRSGCSCDSPVGSYRFFHRLFALGRDSNAGNQALFPHMRRASFLEALLHQSRPPCSARRRDAG